MNFSNNLDTELYLRKWQRILSLSDWGVELVMVGNEINTTLNDMQGMIEICFSSKSAVLYCASNERLNVYSRTSNNVSDQDMIIIHKLLHLHLETMKVFDCKAADEQCINSLARAYVAVANDKDSPKGII